MTTLLNSIRPWQVVLGVSVIYLGVILAQHNGDARAWATVGSDYKSCDDPEYDPGNTAGGGYIDGQISYFVARDGLAAAACADIPAYRLQRILLPATAGLLALGNDDLIPWLLVAINLSALVGGTFGLEKLLESRSVTRWYALVYGLAAGNLLGLRLSTTEPLAFGLVVLAIWLMVYDRPWLPAILLALAALAKEQTLVFAAGYGLYFLITRRWSAAMRLTLIVGIPFALWQFILLLTLGSLGIGSGGEGATGFELIPFGGYMRIFTESGGSWRVFLVMSAYIFPSVILPTLVGGWAVVRDLWQQAWQSDTLLLLLNLLVMVTLPFTTFGEPLGLLRVMLGLILSYLIFAARRFRNTRALKYSWLWLALNIYLMAG